MRQTRWTMNGNRTATAGALAAVILTAVFTKGADAGAPMPKVAAVPGQVQVQGGSPLSPWPAVELKVAAPSAFPGANIQLPEIKSLRLVIDYPGKGAASAAPRVESVVFASARAEKFFEWEPTPKWDEAAKKLVLTGKPRVITLYVDAPASGPALPRDESAVRVQFERINGSTGTVPAKALNWTVQVGRGELQLLPAAFEDESVGTSVIVEVTGFGKGATKVALENGKTIKFESERVEPDVLPPDLPNLTKYVKVREELTEHWKYIGDQKYDKVSGLWTSRAKYLPNPDKGPPDEHFFVLPGYVPLWARTIPSRHVELWSNVHGRYLQHHEPPPEREFYPGRLDVTIKLPLSDRYFDFVRQFPIRTSARVQVLIGEDVIVGHQVLSIADDIIYGFPLPDLYYAAGLRAKRAGKTMAEGFEELETKGVLRLVFDDKSASDIYDVPDVPLKSVGAANFGLSPRYVRPASAGMPEKVLRSGRNEAPVTLQVANRVHILELKADGAGINPRNWGLRFVVMRTDGKPVVLKGEGHLARGSAEPVLFEPESKRVVVAAGGFDRAWKRELVIESDQFEAVTVPLDTKDLRRTIELRPAGLLVKLPSGLRDPEDKVHIQVTTPDLELKPLIEVDHKKTRLTRADTGNIDLRGAHVVLRVPGFKPRVVPKMSVSELPEPGQILQPQRDKKKLVVIVNDWAAFTSSNEAVQDNIKELQKKVCRDLADSAVKAGARTLGFSLVEPGDGKLALDDKVKAYVIEHGEQAPIPPSARYRNDRPDEFWQRLRTLLMSPEVAGEHYTVRIIIVTPYRLQLSPTPAGGDKAWIEKLAADRAGVLKVATVVLGGPEAPKSTAEKQYLGLQLLRVNKEDINDGENVSTLPKWLEDKVLKEILAD